MTTDEIQNLIRFAKDYIPEEKFKFARCFHTDELTVFLKDCTKEEVDYFEDTVSQRLGHYGYNYYTCQDEKDKELDMAFIICRNDDSDCDDYESRGKTIKRIIPDVAFRIEEHLVLTMDKETARLITDKIVRAVAGDIYDNANADDWFEDNVVMGISRVLRKRLHIAA